MPIEELIIIILRYYHLVVLRYPLGLLSCLLTCVRPIKLSKLLLRLRLFIATQVWLELMVIQEIVRPFFIIGSPIFILLEVSLLYGGSSFLRTVPSIALEWVARELFR